MVDQQDDQLIMYMLGNEFITNGHAVMQQKFQPSVCFEEILI